MTRAQFNSLAKQIPLLYLILICNALAIVSQFYRPEFLLETLVVPFAICLLALVRSLWWLRQDETIAYSDAAIAHMLKRTSRLAVVMTVAFTAWGMWVYEFGDPYARGHLTFFLALTQVSSVFCLMAIRAAAMRVAVTSTLMFISYFSWIDDGRMLPAAVVLLFVSAGMIVVTLRYNKDFSDLIRSQQDLRQRQSEAERLSDENRRVAFTDALSGLPNRRHLLARLDVLERQSDLACDSLAVMFIDLDGFKDINDAHGHQAGDALIGALSQRLQEICPPGATLARVGGDEFAVLIEATNATMEAQILAQAISEEVSLPVLVDRHVLQVGASIGIAGNSEGPLSAHELLRRADTAMYHVKTSGKGSMKVYDQSFDEGRKHRLAIENQIGRALENDEFEVVYQPIVDAQTGAFVCAEALVRWNRRPEGAFNPSQFIEIAEATGQIHPLGLFVLGRACEDLLALDDLKVSVNVSPAQFHDPGFERNVVETVMRSGIRPDRLQLEITEGYLLSRPDRAMAAIRTFKELGMSIALDDFGTGFTSIYYLQSYGFSHIKIDKSLLHGLKPNNKVCSLVTGAIYLANGLDIMVTAEGVETEMQAAILRDAGCQTLQGFAFARPMPLPHFLHAYQQNRARVPKVIGIRHSA